MESPVPFLVRQTYELNTTTDRPSIVKQEQEVTSDTIDPDWVASSDEISRTLIAFVEEFETFTPDLFAAMKIHLLRSGLTKAARDNICSISIEARLCPKCDFLYKAKRCLLWYRLYHLIDWKTVERAPPCIRLAFAKKTIRTVANYLTYVNLLNPPFYQKRIPSSCNMLHRWGYCNPNEYCRAMKNPNPAEYMAAREHVKLSRGHHG